MISVQDNNLISYDQWLYLRKDSLGASEIGPIIYGNNYTSSLEIFYQKITGIKKSVTTLRSYIGKKSENICDTLWPFYEEGRDESIYINAEKNNYLKKCHNTNSTYKNSKFPHITVTPDRIIEPYGKYASMGTGCLEYKNTQSHILQSFTTGLPTDNVIQVCSQMNVREDAYCEIFYFLDNKTCQLHAGLKKDFKTMWQMILDVTTPFWENVQKGRVLYNKCYEAKRNFDYRLAAEIETEIAQLEPEPQGSLGYLNYLTERYKERASGGGLRAGTEAELMLARKHKELSNKIDKIEKQQRQVEIEIKLAMKETTVLDFSKSGKVTWLPNKNGSRIFKNSIIK